jgi:hypothetical protein
MSRRERTGLLVISLFLTLYVLVFIPPNLTGAKDPNMLAAFQIDEWLQYPHVMRMTTHGETFTETLTNIFVYRHYFYGYPFYLSSALAILPLRAAAGFVPLEASIASTSVIMVVLRQLSPLLMVIAVALLVYNWTGFARPLQSLLVVVLLLSVPAVFANNLWWHAESLVVLLVAVTIFALNRDNLRFGRWFAVAAVACGLSAGTKQVGFWFFLTVAVYLALGWRRGGWSVTIRRGALFAGLMALTIIVSNPLLVIPEYAGQIIDTQLLQADRIAFGWDMAMTRGPTSWYEQTLRLTYGFWWLYVLALVACLWATMAGGKHRLLGLIILTYVLPFSLYLLFFVAAKPARYFLPVMLPLYAALGYEALLCWDRRKPLRVALSLIGIIAVLFQIGIFLRWDVVTYQATLEREASSPALAFNDRVEVAYNTARPDEPPQLIYRDPAVYVSPREGSEIVMSWDLPTFDYINRLNPDLILLHKYNIRRYADPEFVRNNYRPDQAQRNAEFYAAAVADQVPGYSRLLEDAFGLALIRRDIAGSD